MTAANPSRKLSERVLKLLDASDDERIAAIGQPIFIPYTRANDLLAEMEGLLSHPKTNRMPNMLIVARSNNGKTEILRQFLKRHPAEERADFDTAHVPVVYIQSPPGPSEHIFLNMLLGSLGMMTSTNEAADRKLLQVLEILRMVETKVLLVDEVNALLAGSVAKQRFFLNMLKYLSNELKISIVAAGTLDAVHAMKTDLQIESRFPVRPINLWQEGEDFRRLLVSFESVLPLKKPSVLHKGMLPKKLYGVSEGMIGELAKTLRSAAQHAIKTGVEQITEEVIDECPHVVNRQTFNPEKL